MPGRNPLDLFDNDALIGDEDRLVRDSVARFVDSEILPSIADWHEQGRFPRELIPKLADLGLLGMSLTGYGCAGLSHLGYGLVCSELERGDSSFRSFVSVQTSLVMECIDATGSEAQKDRWLPRLASGELIGCFGLTEAQGGSDPAAMQTRAKKHRNGWELNGSKHWITNATLADIAIVWARADEAISAFVVPLDADGVERVEVDRKLSLRTSNTGVLHFSAVALDEDLRLPDTDGLKSALKCLTKARYGIAWGALGAARACLAEVLPFVADRRSFGSVLAGKQLVQARLADAIRRLTSAELMAWRLAALLDEGKARAEQVSLAKWNNVRMALDIARECRDLLGAAGITLDHVSARHAQNLESVVTYEGTESIHQLVVGRAITGEAAF